MKTRTSKPQEHSIEPLRVETAAPADSLLPGELLVELSGVRYRLSARMDDLADAEERWSREGRQINVLHSFAVLNLSTTRTLWVCSLNKYHPEIGYDDALELLTPAAALIVGGSFAELITASLTGRDGAAK